MALNYTVAVKDDTNIYPLLLKADVETTARFTCISTVNPKWYFSLYDRIPVYTSLLSVGNELVINWIKLQDSGFYFCSGIDIETHRRVIAMSQLMVYGEFILLMLINKKITVFYTNYISSTNYVLS